MYKCAGTINYPFGSISLSDPNKIALGYKTKKEADEHTNKMNAIRLQFDSDTSWNKPYWEDKQPENGLLLNFKPNYQLKES